MDYSESWSAPLLLRNGNEGNCLVCFSRPVCIDTRKSLPAIGDGRRCISAQRRPDLFFGHMFYDTGICCVTMVAGGKLWWADDDSGQLGTVTKRDGRNPAILRNKTGGVIHMKVYDREAQKGNFISLFASSETHTGWRLLSAPNGCWLCLTFRKKPVSGKQRRVFAALPAHLWEHQELLVHRRIQPPQWPRVLWR